MALCQCNTKKGTREMIIKSMFWHILQKEIADRKRLKK